MLVKNNKLLTMHYDWKGGGLLLFSRIYAKLLLYEAICMTFRVVTIAYIISWYV